MRYYFLLLMLIIGTAGYAQEEVAVTDTVSMDTTIYEVVEMAPRFPACEGLDTTIAVKQKCAEQQLLAFLYQNINYPFEARRQNIEGTIVLRFVVEMDGTISNSEVMRDIGGGCGEEALRIVNAMNGLGIRWVPGQHKGQDVRARYVLPVRFKLQAPPDFEIVQGDSIWQVFDKPLQFIGGGDSLANFLSEKLKYPKVGNDSCLIGNIDVQVLVRSNGDVRVLEMTDYNGLGDQFWYEAINATTSTIGHWDLAEHKGRKVPAAFDMTLGFTPEAEHCKVTIEQYNEAIDLINEGNFMIDGEDAEQGLKMMSKALELFPNDGAMLIARGQAYMELNRFSEACVDLSKAKQIALVDWFDAILPMICQ
ncbi:MAG: TonB family protein [Bacteroidetes bacterium]|nr:MAG: TonB family protein [Bacteroidota bacterium]